MKHFNRSEYSHSDTARAKGMTNIPTDYQYTKYEILVENILDPLRDYIKSPIIITSGFRTESLNKHLKGAKDSQHLARGESVAVDIVCKNLKKTFEYLIQNFVVDQAILEKDKNNKRWIHISLNVSGNNRNEYLRYNKGKYTNYEILK